MTNHLDKGILEIKYNNLNLPKYIKFNHFVARVGGDVYSNTTYSYRADGVKTKKIHYYFSGKTKTDAYRTTEYIDGFQYKTETALVLGSNGLQFFATSEGYFDFVNNRYIYHYNDHLGNVRVSFARVNNTATIIEKNDYYAFGLKHGGNFRDDSGVGYNYEYNGKEMQEEIGMYDYGARFYMPDLGRWGVVDPLAEISRRFTPYHYGNNNPMRFIDPDGRSSQTFTGEDAQNAYWHFYFGGSVSNFSGSYTFGSSGESQNNSFSANFSYFDPGGSSGGGGGSSLSPWMQNNIFYNVHVGENGKVSKTTGDSKNYHRFFDNRGIQMFFNDPNGVNDQWLRRGFSAGDRLYYPISIDAMLGAINSVSSNSTIKFLRVTSGTGSLYATIANESAFGEADFSKGFLSKSIGEDGDLVYENDSSYNIRFGNTNTIFSLMDAGNAMWGLWMHSLGMANHEIKAGSHLYELIWNQSFDTPADQRAIFYFIN